MRDISKFIAVALSVLTVMGFLSSSPQMAYAQGTGTLDPSTGIVNCGNDGKPCTANQAWDFIKNVLKYIFYYLIIPLAMFGYGYAGFKLILGSSDPKSRGEGIEIIKNTTIGFIVAFGAWILIKFILTVLQAKNFTNPLG